MSIRGTMTPDTYKPVLQVSVIPTDKKAEIGLLDDHFGQDDHHFDQNDHQNEHHVDQNDHLGQTDQFGQDDRVDQDDQVGQDDQFGQDDRVGQDDHVEQDGQDDNVDDIGRSLKIKCPLSSNWRFMLNEMFLQ